MPAVAYSIQQAVRVIASRCDGAREQDGIGFNGRDSHFGKSLAAIPHDNWSPKQLECAHRMLATYRAQLASVGIDYDALQKPEVEFKARMASREQQAPKAPPKKIIPKRITREEAKNRWLLEFPFDGPLVESLKKLGLKSFRDEDSLRWLWPVYETKISEVLPLIQDFEGAADLLADRLEKERMLEANRKGSGAVSASQNLTITSRSGKKTRAYQEAGVEYALRVKRVLNADQMGLGKTIQGIATLALAKQWPALIVPPAGLKLNWKKELAEWGSGLRVEVVEKKKHVPSGRAEVYIANYDILTGEDFYMLAGMDRPITKAELKELNAERVKKGVAKLKPKGHFVLDTVAAKFASMKLQAIVFDEFHYCKNEDSRRSKAAKALAKDVPYRIGFTGTPIENRPKELVHQLDILGWLHEFGGYMGFIKRYCAATETAYGWDDKGASNTQELHRRLKETCYIRRLKEEVLSELPPKIYARIPIELSNWGEYEAAESDYLDWVANNEGAAAAERASRAEEVTRLNGLMKIAARGKIKGVREWVDGFLEAAEKLVLFAHHIEVQHELLVAFPGAVAIKGGAKPADTEEAKRKFYEDPAVNLIVCSTKAGGVGHNLHANGKCSSVALAEFPWTPAAQEQCEDRVHRMGQTAECVNVYELYAPGTVDEDTLELLDDKRKVVDAVTDGAERERRKAESIEAVLIERMKKKAAQRKKK